MRKNVKFFLDYWYKPQNTTYIKLGLNFDSFIKKTIVLVYFKTLSASLLVLDKFFVEFLIKKNLENVLNAAATSFSELKNNNVKLLKYFSYSFLFLFLFCILI